MWINIPNGIILLSLVIIGVALYLHYGDWGKWSKPKQMHPELYAALRRGSNSTPAMRRITSEYGGFIYEPQRNCRCTPVPWTNLVQAEKKMIRNAKNFLVQAQYGVPSQVKGTSWRSFMSEDGLKKWEEFLEERKEQKMKKGLVKREELCGKYFATPTEEIWNAVVKMLEDAGFETAYGVYWDGHANIMGKAGPSYPCILTKRGGMAGRMGFTSRGWFEQSGEYSEMSLAELSDILARPTHTLMTAAYLLDRLQEGVVDEEQALALSIDKHERLLKEENWDELQKHRDTYMRADTCGLCQFHLDKGEGTTRCGSCCLAAGWYTTGRKSSCSSPGHAWKEAMDAVCSGDHDKFVRNEKILLDLMTSALAELRRPKRTYKVGQWFRNAGGGLYLLARTDTMKNGSVPVALINGESGGRWSIAVNVEAMTAITEEQLVRIADNEAEDFIPVDVQVTVVNKEKK